MAASKKKGMMLLAALGNPGRGEGASDSGDESEYDTNDSEDEGSGDPMEEFRTRAKELFPDQDPDALWELISLCVEASGK